MSGEVILKQTDVGEFLLVAVNFHQQAPFIPVYNFNKSADALQTIIQEFSDKVCNSGQIEDIYVYAPEEGSFRQWIAIPTWTIGIIFGAIQTPIGEAFVEGLTQHKPSYWAKEVGAEIREGVLRVIDEAKVIKIDKNAQMERLEKELSALILVESLKGIITRRMSEIHEADFTDRKFDKMRKAKNSFIDACTTLENLEGISFGRACEAYTSKGGLNQSKEVVDQTMSKQRSVYEISHEVLHISSPNWDKDDEKRLWKARDDEGTECYFQILDASFWSSVDSGEIDLKIINDIEVQWTFVRTSRTKTSGLVAKVIKFNSRRIGDPLSDQEFRNHVLYYLVRLKGFQLGEDFEFLKESEYQKFVGGQKNELPLFDE